MSTMRMRLIDFEDKMSVTDYHKLGWLAPIRCNFDIDGFTLLPASNELIYYGDPRYWTTLAKTPSDGHSGENAALTIINKMF